MPRPTRLPIALCALALSGGLAVAAGAGADPVAHTARNCGSTSNQGSLRGGYYLALVVKGVGCASGRSVQVGFQGCRLKHGARGRCNAKVSGFTCHEQRQSISVQITGNVSCKRGAATVSYTYQQNLV